jgi:hypothetical protein
MLEVEGENYNECDAECGENFEEVSMSLYYFFQVEGKFSDRS